MRVLTLAHCTSYIDLTASLIFSLVALMSTIKTSVLISSIFFMADSVVNGNLMIANLSILAMPETDFLVYLGSRFFSSVLGLKKCTFLRTFDDLRDTACLTTFETFAAFLPPVSPSAFAPPFFGAMVTLSTT